MAKLELSEFMREVHHVAVEKGWWTPGDQKTDLECMMLMCSEIAEAAEEIRKGSPAIYEGENGKPEGTAVELADCILRILDYAEYKKLPLLDALLAKHAYNKTRSYRHGGKLK